jgi:hypothetical protein
VNAGAAERGLVLSRVVKVSASERRRIMKKTAVAVCAVSVVALLVGVVVAATASSDLTGPRTITVIEKETQAHFVDVGRKGPSLGDQFVFSGLLLQNGKTVGHDGGHCTFVHLHPAQGECEATFKLPGGKITAQALLNFGNGPQTFDIAVNGGTSVFRNARGQATIEELSQTNSKITFHLIP